jgi:N-acetylneuraminic acid mutarotase
MKQLFILFFFCINQPHAQNWQQIEDFSGTPRDDASSFMLNNDVYVGLGMDNGFQCQTNFKKFNTINQSWENTTGLPLNEERQYATSFSWEGKGYIFGGLNCNGDFLNDLWSYDPLINEWEELPSLPSFGRSGMSNFVIDGKVYVVGGKTSNTNFTNEVWCFDFILNNWIQKASLPITGFWKGIAFTSNTLGYISLGKDSETTLNLDTYSYTAEFNTWVLVSGFPISPRTYSSAVQNDEFLFIYGGVDEAGVILNDTYRIDLTNLNTEELSVFPAESRKGGQLFISDFDLYLTTGISTTERKKETWKLAQAVSVDLIEMEASIFPNPFTNEIHITIENTASSFELLNELGVILKQGKITKYENQINTDELALGIYFLRLNVAGKVKIYKLIKQ